MIIEYILYIYILCKQYIFFINYTYIYIIYDKASLFSTTLSPTLPFPLSSSLLFNY